jgi:hypothetical protein
MWRSNSRILQLAEASEEGRGPRRAVEPMIMIKNCINNVIVFPWRWGGSSTQAWMPTYVSILRIPQMIWVCRPTVEWYWQGKAEELWEKPLPVPLCPPEIPHGLTRARTRASAVRGRRLTTWAMSRPNLHLTLIWISSKCISYTVEEIHGPLTMKQ